jgi:hypothetical protein
MKVLIGKNLPLNAKYPNKLLINFKTKENINTFISNHYIYQILDLLIF